VIGTWASAKEKAMACVTRVAFDTWDPDTARVVRVDHSVPRAARLEKFLEREALFAARRGAAQLQVDPSCGGDAVQGPGGDAKPVSQGSSGDARGGSQIAGGGSGDARGGSNPGLQVEIGSHCANANANANANASYNANDNVAPCTDSIVRFAGIEIETVPGVCLTPRGSTESLVEHVVAACLATERAAPGVPRAVLDLGTGSGNVLLAILARLPGNWIGHGTDVSEACLEIARRNAQRVLGLAKDAECSSDASAAAPRATFSLAAFADGIPMRPGACADGDGGNRDGDQVGLPMSDDGYSGAFIWDVVCSNPPYMAAGKYAELFAEHKSKIAMDPILALVHPTDAQSTKSASTAAYAEIAASVHAWRVAAPGAAAGSGCFEVPAVEPAQSQAHDGHGAQGTLTQAQGTLAQAQGAQGTLTQAQGTLTQARTQSRPQPTLPPMQANTAPRAIPRGHTLLAVEISVTERRFGQSTRRKVARLLGGTTAERVAAVVAAACPGAREPQSARDARGIERVVSWIV
jgi:methylase of polypeptide subunit release factors